MRYLHNLTLQSHLTIAFVAVALAPLIILGAVQVWENDKATREIGEVQMQLTQRLADETETYITHHRHAVEALAAGFTSTAERDKSILTSHIRSVKHNFPGFINLYVADKNGKTIAFYPETDTMGKSLIGYDFSDRDYFRQVSVQGVTIISSLFQGRGGTSKPLITIVAPIFSGDHKFDGYVLGAIDLSMVEQFAAKYILGGQTHAVVVDKAGKAIYHPSPEIRQTVADLSAEPVLQRLTEGLHGSGRFFSPQDKQEEFITYTVIPHLDWVVWMSRPYALYEQQLGQSMRIMFLLLLGSFVAMILLGWLLARWFNSTITILVNYTKKLASEPLETVSMPIMNSNNAPYELNVLSENFHTMAVQLQENERQLLELNAALEERVADRTKQLQGAVSQNAILLEQAQRQREAMGAILESMSDAIVIVDLNGRVLYANERLAELFDISLLHLLNAPEKELREAIARLIPDKRQALSDLFAGKRNHAIITVGQEEGKTRHITGASFLVRSSNQIKGRGYVWRDVTKEYEIDQLKNSLISLASHEFKTPITNIRGSIETLLRRDAEWDIDFQKELLKDVLEDIGRIQTLVDDWLDISKIDAGMLAVRPVPLSAEGLITDVVEHFRQRWDFTWEVSVALGMPPVTADRNRLEQVLINLVSNALRYNDRKPHLAFRLDYTEQDVFIHVQDNGIGINEQDLERVFERFYQVDSSSTRRLGGTGLGLAICKGIIEAHGGRLKVSSTLGLGSTFTIILPRAGEEGDAREETADLYY